MKVTIVHEEGQWNWCVVINGVTKKGQEIALSAAFKKIDRIAVLDYKVVVDDGRVTLVGEGHD